jgi:retinol dehydrogenase-12
MACKSVKKGNVAAAKILEETKSRSVYVEELDLADLTSIRNFADRFRSHFGRLDILINNAGFLIFQIENFSSNFVTIEVYFINSFKEIVTLQYIKTKDNFESQFGIHHLGHFYLTNLLLDLLKTSEPSRVVVLASESHEGNFQDLTYDESFIF